VSSVIYNAPPTVGAFMRDNSFIRGLMGPFGSGKSVGCVMELLRRAMEQKPGPDRIRHSRWAIVRNTYPELRDTTRKTFEDWMPFAKGAEGWSESEFSFTLRLPMRDGTSVEAEFLFRALDRPEHVKKLLSLELTGVWINEAREVPHIVLKMLVGRVNRYPSMRDGGATWSGIMMDTNPPDDDSWWYRMFEEERPSNARIFKQPGGRDQLAENLGHWEHPKTKECLGHYAHESHPGARWVLHHNPDYYKNLVAANASDPLWIKVHVDAQYGPTMDGKPIYPEFQDHLHVIPPEKVSVLAPGSELLLGADFGLTPALLIGQRDPKDGQVQWIDEIVSEDMGAARFFEDASRYLKRTYPGRPVRGTGDPAGEGRSQVDERTPFDVALAAGVPLSPARTNDFIRRRDAVGRALTRMTLLGRPSLVVSSRCKVTRKGMNGAYCFKRVASAGNAEKFRDVPDKNSFSHICEAGQYMMIGEGEDFTAIEGASSKRKVHSQFKVKRCGMSRGRA
jgi:hypothetical protein